MAYAEGNSCALRAEPSSPKRLASPRPCLRLLTKHGPSRPPARPPAGGGARPSEADSAELYACLRQIFGRAPDFGGGLFALAASVVTDLIHHDPLVYRRALDLGLCARLC